MTSQFDRVRPRTGPGAPSVGPVAAGVPLRSVDVDGKSALFSSSPLPVRLGTVALSCSACRTRTIVGYGHALRLAIPSLHLLLLRRDYPSWMRCPACQRRTWVRIDLR